MRSREKPTSRGVPGKISCLASGISYLALVLLSACGVPEQPAAIVEESAFSRIAFGCCAFQWVEQPIFRTIFEAEPDLFLSLGDAIHGDFDGEKSFVGTPEVR